MLDPYQTSSVISKAGVALIIGAAGRLGLGMNGHQTNWRKVPSLPIFINAGHRDGTRPIQIARKKCNKTSITTAKVTTSYSDK